MIAVIIWLEIWTIADSEVAPISLATFLVLFQILLERILGRTGELGREDCVESEVREMESFDIQMVTGIFSGEKLDELTKFIINKFAEEKLNRDEAVEVLKRLEDVIGECSVVQHMD